MIRLHHPRFRSISMLRLFSFLFFFGALHTAALKAGESGVRSHEGQKAAEAEKNVIRFGPRSAWSASTRSGRSLGGTWTAAIDLSSGTASGTWTLRDSASRILLRGTWSAAKMDREWKGGWRALVAGQTKEHSGTWSCGLELPADAPLVDLFEQAVRQAINGTWRSGAQSGGWSIRAVR